MEDNINIFEKGRRPQFFFENRRQPQKQMQPKTIKRKNNNIFKNGTGPQLF